MLDPTGSSIQVLTRTSLGTLVLSRGAATPTRSSLARLRPMPLQLLNMKNDDQHLTTNKGSLAQPYKQDEEMKLLGLCSAQI